MFLEQTMKRNPDLIETAFDLHRQGALLPDSFVVDVDTLMANAGYMLDVAKQAGIRLYFMLKQLGRNPYIAKELISIGYEGAVVVDYKEADIMMKASIPISNIGHLVQVPQSQVERVVAYGPEVITVFSMEKIKTIDQAAARLGRIQGLLIRVYDENDHIYSGQTAGFSIKHLTKTVAQIKRECPHVIVKGVTSFPCYLYDEEQKKIVPTGNLQTVLHAVEILKEAGIACEIINTPSATCAHTIGLMKQYGGNCGEPGHGLTGTTPMHAAADLEECPCVVYVSEISHNFDDKAYCFGGGHYRRSHVAKALVGTDRHHGKILDVLPPSDESIDYHFGLSESCAVGDTVVMAFRYQIFVTRSDVVLVKGLKSGKPEMIGIYDSLGRQK